MLAPKRIRSRALRRLVESGDASGVRADWRPKVERILSQLNVAVSAQELNVPGMGWHMLKGNRMGTYSVKVSGNWRITFRWDEAGPFDVDLEDYHG